MSDPSWVTAVWNVFSRAGVPPEVWVPIMLHESSAVPGIFNDTRSGKDRNGNPLPAGIRPEYSVGLFQINVHAKGLTPAEEEDLATKLKDPVTNATYAAAAMAPAWAIVQGLGLNKAEWAGAVGTRSGWPAGHPDDPCTTDYCAKIAVQFQGVFSKWANAINLGPNYEAGSDLIAPYFSSGVVPNNVGGTTGGQSSYNSVTSAPGYYPPGGASGGTGSYTNASTDGGAGSSPDGSTSGAASIFPFNPGPFIDASGKAVQKDLNAWAKSDQALTVLFFAMGLGLFLIVAYALLSEGARTGTEQTVKILTGSDIAGGTEKIRKAAGRTGRQTRRQAAEPHTANYKGPDAKTQAAP